MQTNPFLESIRQSLNQPKDDFLSRLRISTQPQSTSAFAPPFDGFDDQLKEMSSYPIEKVNKAIDLHPDIQDKEGAKKYASNARSTIPVAKASSQFEDIGKILNVPNKLAGGIVETAALNLKKPEETFSEYYERLPGLTDIAGKSIIETSQKVLGEKYGKAVGQAGAFIAALTLDPFNLTPSTFWLVSIIDFPAM